MRRLWDEVAATGNGQLTRSGPASPRGVQDVLEADVVALAVDGGAAQGPDSDGAGADGADGGPNPTPGQRAPGERPGSGSSSGAGPDPIEGTAR